MVRLQLHVIPGLTHTEITGATENTKEASTQGQRGVPRNRGSTAMS